MKLQKLLPAFAGICVLLITSCKPEEPDTVTDKDVLNTGEMKVPSSFDYSTTKVVDFDFSIESIWGKQKMRLDIYDFMPNAGGEVISRLYVSGHGHISGDVIVPSGLDELYTVVTYPDGSSISEKVVIQGNTATHIFSTKKNSRKTVITSPDCATGCGTVVNNSNSMYNADGGGVYCFTGSTSGGITVKNGSTVRICGNGTFELKVEAGGQVEIVDGANITLSRLTLNSTADKITVYPNAVVSVQGWATPASDVVNYGEISFEHLDIAATSGFTNYGNVWITGSDQYNVAGSLINEGGFYCSGDLIQNSNGSIANHCSMTVANQLRLESEFQNHGFVSVEGTLYINGGGQMEMHHGAMTMAEDLHLDGIIEGVGTTSLIKLNDQITGNSSGQIKGALDFCDANGVEATFSGMFIAPAAQACNVYIPVNDCNPEGNGNPQFTDDDADGVVNSMDMFPADPQASGATFYPSGRTFATLLFEDLWPGMGDYDFNDLVMGYSHMLVTNSNNQVVRMESQFLVKAIGGSFKNGFGFQLNIAPSEVAGITGQQLTKNIVSVAANGTELGQNKATIIVFDNAYSTIHNTGGTVYVNTVGTEPARQADTVKVVTTFSNPQEIASLGMGPYNPFIFINEDRGRELHLVNNEPTQLANPSYFQSSSDDSDPATGRYYKSDKGHPWALNIKGDIKHMEEKIDIAEGYNFFTTWAQSGGTQALDWYSDHAGYRNKSKLY